MGQPLQFDSTVNYALDETEVATTDADRAKPTPWNTYAMAGLPATPICSPSIAALQAAEHPADGPWLYFVTVDQQGTTLFTDSYAEHLATSNWRSETVSSTVVDEGGVDEVPPASDRRRPSRRRARRPVAHSRSPQLHLAAYRALGLDGWTYERIECSAEQLPGFVRSRGPEWAGLSVTMPGKFAALDVADSQSDRALLCGSANTLVHSSQGWRADNTDIDGVRGALQQGGVVNLEGASAVVLGAGGTARPAVYALAELGVAKITVVARDANRARTAIELSATLGMPARVIDLDEHLVAQACAASMAVVNTMPATAAAELSRPVSEAPFVLDAIYDPWPTPLASAVTAAGGRWSAGC